ncbi:hypothetical protein PENSTE_c023G09623 [Penicillium steckii]|uniref:Uncharacterized protein n=1 Tax=Penicillium steckii TaxID=303698 RepID=A0A1V6SSP9_9EURO|nr:hypothetical protein PENSTE_c023G09623 [Penicillium steckii]
MGSSNDSLSTKSPSEQRNNDAISSESNQSEGVLATVKDQIHFATGGRSISQFGSEVSSVVGETVQETKETVAPLAENAIHTVQARVQSLTGNTNSEEASETKQASDLAVDETEHKKIDQLDNEHICDFLREKHMSTKIPPSVTE